MSKMVHRNKKKNLPWDFKKVSWVGLFTTTNLAKTSSNVGTNTTQTMSDDRLIGKLDRVIEKEKPKEETLPDENAVFSLPKNRKFLIMKILK